MLNSKNLKFLSTVVIFSVSLSDLFIVAYADEKPPGEHKNHGMRMDMKGMVMNENIDNIPKDCPEISEDVTIAVKAGVKYAKQYPGTVFGYDKHQWQVKPCARITVEFTNEDEIRHQWMIHGLPKYLYSQGMFHIEVNGSGKKTGTFIVPSSHYTYLVHCDIAQHMEKGMKAQLKAGKGRGDLPSIPGISDPVFPDTFQN